MVKLGKRIVSAVLAGVMMISSAANCYATNAIAYKDQERQSLASEAYKYACEQMPYHLETLEYDMSNTTISNVFPVYQHKASSKNTDIFICFALENNIVIGNMIIWYENGEFYSDFGIGEFPELKNAFTDKNSIAFIADNESIYMLSERGAYIFSSPYGEEGDKCTEKDISVRLCEIRLERIQQTKKLADRETELLKSTSNNNPYVKLYAVPLIANVKNYDGHPGICWAACIASKVRYELGYQYSKLSAEKVHDDTKKYNKNICPTGKKRYQIGMKVYGMTPNTNTDERIFSLEQIIQKADKTNEDKDIIIMRLKTENNHAVLFSGCNIIYDTNNNVSNKSTYRIMDPNKKNAYRSVTVNQDIVDGKVGFSCSVGSQIGKWFDTMYKV